MLTVLLVCRGLCAILVVLLDELDPQIPMPQLSQSGLNLIEIIILDPIDEDCLGNPNRELTITLVHQLRRCEPLFDIFLCDFCFELREYANPEIRQ